MALAWKAEFSLVFEGSFGRRRRRDASSLTNHKCETLQWLHHEENYDYIVRSTGEGLGTQK